MDSKLSDAINKQLGATPFELQFIKSFRKVFGIPPVIDAVREDNTVEAHGETWGLDGHDWLLWDDGQQWHIATPELLAAAGGLDV